MTLHSTMIASKLLADNIKLAEFLHRFLHAANSHTELVPFIEEGEALLRSVEDG